MREAVGGLAYGAAIGYAGYWLIKPLADPRLELLITICIASVGYVFAQHIGISGPLAMVVAGLIIGNQARQHALTPEGQHHLDTFWEVTEELLNAMLFLLIGFELIILPIDHGMWFVAGAIAIPLVLLSRFITVAVPWPSLNNANVIPPW